MKMQSRGIAIAVPVILLMAFLSWKRPPPERVRKSSIHDIETTEDLMDPRPVQQTPARSDLPVEQVKPPTEKPADITPEQLTELRSMAKTSLSASYTAQKSFFAEYGRYTTDLKAAGLEPVQPEMRYKFGFISPYQAAAPADSQSIQERPTRMSTDDFIGDDSQTPGEKFRYSAASQALNLSQYSKFCQKNCTAGEDAFEMLMVVPLANTGKVDVWLVNQEKELILVHDGMKDPVRPPLDP